MLFIANNANAAYTNEAVSINQIRIVNNHHQSLPLNACKAHNKEIAFVGNQLVFHQNVPFNQNICTPLLMLAAVRLESILLPDVPIML